MAKGSYIFKRGSSYSARLRLPDDVAKILGKKELVKGLGTREPSEASRRVLPVVAAWFDLIDRIRAKANLTDADIQEAALRHYERELEHDETARAHAPSEAEIDKEIERTEKRIAALNVRPEDRPLAVLQASLEALAMTEHREFEANARDVRLKTLREHLASGETALVDDAVSEHVTGEGYTIPDGSAERRKLGRAFLRAEIEAVTRAQERDRGDYTGRPRDTILQPATDRVKRAKPGETILEIFDQYAKENPRRVSADTMAVARRDIGVLVDVIGAHAGVEAITKKSVREWKALLLQMPVKASETNAFAGLSLAKIVERNRTVGKPVITPKTVNRHLSSLSAFCTWLVAHGHLDSNPVHGMFLQKEQKAKTGVFSSEQLTRLFASPLFTGCESDEWGKWYKPGAIKINDHRYWIALMMLFSGARPGELAQLNIADVRQEHDVWVMHITEEGDGGKTVKTAGSMRVLPVHSELIKLGLIEYRNEMATRGEKRLFPLAQRNGRGQWVADFSREFVRYLVRVGIRDGEKLSLYSFRHGAADAFRRAGLLDQQFGHLLGHGAKTMTGRYGHLPQGVLADSAALIERIAYPGLNLSHLFRA